MEIIRQNAAIKEEFMSGIFKTAKVKSEALEMLELEIEPGKGLDPHDMPCKVVFFVIEGTGTFTYGDRTEAVKTGEIVHAGPGQLRYWSNNSNLPLRLLVIKSLGEK